MEENAEQNDMILFMREPGSPVKRRKRPVSPERKIFVLKVFTISVALFFILSVVLPSMGIAQGDNPGISGSIDDTRSGSDDSGTNETSDDSSGSSDDSKVGGEESSGESSKQKAQEEIEEAREEIDRAESEISEAKSKGKDTSASEQLLDQAKIKLQEAEAAFDSGDYENAEDLAEQSSDLAEDARMKFLGKSTDELEDDDDHDGVDDDEEDRYEREVKVETDTSEVEVSSHLKNGESRDEFEIEFRAHERIELELDYRLDSDDAETNLELDLRFRSIIEFTDSNGNGIYDSADSVGSIYDLRTAQYDPIDYVTETTVDGETMHVLTASTSDGVLAVVAHITGSFAEIDSGTITPSEVKIDIIISNFPYTSSSSLLALNMTIESKAETEMDDHTYDEEKGYAENEEELELDAAEVTAFFSWVKEASVDGEMKPVESVTSSGGDDHHTTVYFIYPHGNEIIHDPKVGVLNLGGTGSNPAETAMSIMPFIIALAVGGIVIALSVTWRRKKNGDLTR